MFNEIYAKGSGIAKFTIEYNTRFQRIQNLVRINAKDLIISVDLAYDNFYEQDTITVRYFSFKDQEARILAKDLLR